MNPYLVLALLAVYFAALFVVGRLTKGKGDNEAFFKANRNSKWYLVAFGMIGTSLSGVTFISVPGAVGAGGFAYFQMVLGYIVGYAVIAFVLMPIYYRLQLVSIYGYLKERFGPTSYLTGAWIFLVSRSLGSSARFFLVLNVLYLAVFAPLGVPFWLSGVLGLALIWLYTYEGGVKTIIITDTLQTGAMLICLVLCLWAMATELDMSTIGLTERVMESKLSTIFFWDWKEANFFWKQFLAGTFIAIVMTGLDQDMMQKNLTCRNLKEAQTNMMTFTAVLVFVNFLFLVLGAALYLFAAQKGIALPAKGDELFPMIALQHLPTVAGIVFIVGIIAATYASTDSALTALTTSYCMDILGMDKQELKQDGQAEKQRRRVHLGMTLVIFVLVLGFKASDSPSLLIVIFKLAGYTYGPLLGLFAFGIASKRRVRDGLVPYVCVAAPAICFALDYIAKQNPDGYHFGFELLLVNGALAALGLWAVSYKVGGKEGELQTA